MSKYIVVGTKGMVEAEGSDLKVIFDQLVDSGFDANEIAKLRTIEVADEFRLKVEPVLIPTKQVTIR